MSDDDETEFMAHMRGVRPLRGRDRVTPSAPPPRALQIRLRQTSDDRLAHLTHPGEIPASSRAVDGSTTRKLRQGKVPIEGRIDLHGYTQTAARLAFRRFIEGAVQQEKRCVLVITGKGAIGPDGPADIPWGHDDGRGPRGVLRQAIQTWVDEPPMNRLILKLTPAAPKDGGPGAFYVYLRRDRGRE